MTTCPVKQQFQNTICSQGGLVTETQYDLCEVQLNNLPPNETQISYMQETNKIKLKTDGERPKKDTRKETEEENRTDGKKNEECFNQPSGAGIKCPTNYAKDPQFK